MIHLHDELAQAHDRVVVKTRFGPVTGARSGNGAVVFLGKGVVYEKLRIHIRPDMIRIFRNTLRSPAWQI
jgi:hypothetical protein